MGQEQTAENYEYWSAQPSHSAAYLWPSLVSALKLAPHARRVFELGCGNGAIAHRLCELGYSVCGVDPSTSGIAQAKQAYPECRLDVGSAYDPLHATYGTHDVVVSLEVVEHLYSPRLYARAVRDLLEPGGLAIVSTPYHGYLKNLALAVSGRMDQHFTALWDHGHIKFWSRETLAALFAEVGMREVAFLRAGRVPVLAKSMVQVFATPTA